MSKLGERLIQSLDEIIDWTKGTGTLRVTLPGCEAEDLTYDQYCVSKMEIDNSIAEGRAGDPILAHPLTAGMSSDGWPFYYGFTLDKLSLTLVTTGGILRLIVGGQQIYRDPRAFGKAAVPSPDEVLRLCNVEVVA